MARRSCCSRRAPTSRCCASKSLQSGHVAVTLVASRLCTLPIPSQCPSLPAGPPHGYRVIHPAVLHPPWPPSTDPSLPRPSPYPRFNLLQPFVLPPLLQQRPRRRLHRLVLRVRITVCRSGEGARAGRAVVGRAILSTCRGVRDSGGGHGGGLVGSAALAELGQELLHLCSDALGRFVGRGSALRRVGPGLGARQLQVDAAGLSAGARAASGSAVRVPKYALMVKRGGQRRHPTHRNSAAMSAMLSDTTSRGFCG